MSRKALAQYADSKIKNVFHGTVSRELQRARNALSVATANSARKREKLHIHLFEGALNALWASLALDVQHYTTLHIEMIF